jgi:hypothetical protein
LQSFDGVAFHRQGIRHGEGRAEKLRVINDKSVLEVVLEGVPPNKENAKQGNDAAKREEQPDPFGYCEHPPARVEPVILPCHVLN